MRVRLSDIAARAGVSEATVSRVLNDKPGVSEATRNAILTTLDVLGYERPARLRSARAGLVGLIVPELDNPVFPMFAQVIETALAHDGYTPVLCTQTPGGVHEDEYVRMLLARDVSGIVFVSGIHANTDTDPTRYVTLRQRGVPIVLINGYVEGVPAPFISNDDATSVDLAVRHLAQLGHRRIGLALGPSRYVPVQRKTRAFHIAMRVHVDGALSQRDIDEMIAYTVFSVEGGGKAAAQLLDGGATALVCGSDLMALGAVRAARQRGLRVPADVSVVGSDDSLLVEFTDPPLTTVRQAVNEMAAAAARALLDEIEGRPVPRAEFIFRPELIVRGSTAAVLNRVETGLGRS